MVLLQASGESGRPLPQGLLDAVLLQLALEIVADGEGATRVGCARVTRPPTQEEAERAARAIANSPLVKTALFGHDPNWGRIAQAAGMALAGEEVEELGARPHRRRGVRRRGGGGRGLAAAGTRRPRRPCLVLGPGLRVRSDQRRVHDLKWKP